MGFVDGNETDPHVPHFGLEQVGRKPFGRDIQDFHSAEDAVVECGEDFLMRHAAIDGSSANAMLDEVLHLVFHQRDERGDDNTNTFQSQSRHLEGDAFSATRRHQAESVFSRIDAFDNVALDATKVVVSPVLSQNVAEHAL